MEDFIFHEDAPQELKEFGFEPSYFHDPQYLSLKSLGEWKWYYGFQSRTNKVTISLYLHIESNVAQSCVKSPFGTIESAPGTPPEALYKFLEFVEDRLRESGVKKITLKSPPFHYSEERNGLLHTFLFNKGFTVVDAEVGAVRFTTSKFEDQLNRLENRQLKKCLDNGLSYIFHQSEALEKIYSFILACRQRKGYTLSMTFDQLQLETKHFPERYLVVGVYKEEQLVGASIAVRVTSEILYNFYADHDPDFDAMSPVVLVVKALYEHCREHQVKLLDMGTSAIDGQPNFGLLNFKMRLGGVPTPKLTFEKLLSP